MKINTKILGATILVVMLIVTGGCLNKSNKGTEQKTNVTNNQSVTETLDDILGRGMGISSVKYDLIMTTQGAPSTTSKVWLKKNKMRTEATMGGQTIISLMDTEAQTIYTYMPAQNMAMKSDFSGGAPLSPTSNIEEYKPKTIGTETIDGKICSIVEYNAQGENTKSWIWKEKGLPIKIEMTAPEGKTTMEYKNIEFVDIPDNMFELPAGVKITEMPKSAQ
ncbi:MAG: DUF4412 domain-containing protein [Patescibacteria group bacterium]|nr:DUF4412 domain-containing protein [Patescibacteria group bacterium]